MPEARRPLAEASASCLLAGSKRSLACCTHHLATTPPHLDGPVASAPPSSRRTCKTSSSGAACGRTAACGRNPAAPGSAHRARLGRRALPRGGAPLDAATARRRRRRGAWHGSARCCGSTRSTAAGTTTRAPTTRSASTGSPAPRCTSWRPCTSRSRGRAWPDASARLGRRGPTLARSWRRRSCARVVRLWGSAPSSSSRARAASSSSAPVLQSKLYPVYFCAMACGVELALAAHLLLEPKATKVICLTSCVYTYDSNVLAQFLKKSLIHE